MEGEGREQWNVYRCLCVCVFFFVVSGSRAFTDGLALSFARREPCPASPTKTHTPLTPVKMAKTTALWTSSFLKASDNLILFILATFPFKLFFFLLPFLSSLYLFSLDPTRVIKTNLHQKFTSPFSTFLFTRPQFFFSDGYQFWPWQASASVQTSIKKIAVKKCVKNEKRRKFPKIFCLLFCSITIANTSYKQEFGGEGTVEYS